jgi:hypothetical protein
MIFASRIKRKGHQAFDQPLQLIGLKIEDSAIERRIGDANDNLTENFPGQDRVPKTNRSGVASRRKNRTRKDFDKDWGEAR